MKFAAFVEGEGVSKGRKGGGVGGGLDTKIQVDIQYNIITPTTCYLLDLTGMIKCASKSWKKCEFKYDEICF